MNSSVLRRIASGVLAVLLLFYVGYQVYKSHHSTIKTESADYFTASNSVQTTVVAIRKETLLKSSFRGVADYIISSGDKVCQKGTIAKIYENESQVSAQRQLEEVDKSITQLQNLQQPGNTYSFDADNANERICLKLTDILGNVNSGDLSQANSQKGDLLNLMNERQVGTGKIKNFSSRISALQSQRSALTAQAGNPIGSVISPEAGYFIQSTDGMENAFDISQVSSISSSQIRKLENIKRAPVAGAIGKISRDFDWYLVCVIPSDQVIGFKQLDTDETVSIRFPFVSGTSVSATVAAINQADSNSEAAVVLKCMDMNSSLAGIRTETAEVSVKEYTGLRVSQKAVHYETLTKKEKNSGGKTTEVKKDVEGVYVLHGSQLNFRQIIPQFSTDNYVICDPNPNEDDLFTDQTVNLYDEVVVEGTDLYDGKVVQ